jgi:DNA-binding NtrC family response regulator
MVVGVMPLRDDPATILVIDRRELFRALIRETLERPGHRVIAATCAAEALALLEAKAVKLAVIDLLAPQECGVAAMIALRLRSDVPLLAIGRHSDATAPGPFRTQVIGSPFRLEDLADAVAQILALGPETREARHRCAVDWL